MVGAGITAWWDWQGGEGGNKEEGGEASHGGVGPLAGAAVVFVSRDKCQVWGVGCIVGRSNFKCPKACLAQRGFLFFCHDFLWTLTTAGEQQGVGSGSSGEEQRRRPS